MDKTPIQYFEGGSGSLATSPDGAWDPADCAPCGAGRHAERATDDFHWAVINAAPAAIMATDRSGAVILWNTAANKMLGWRETNVLGVQPLPFLTESAPFDQLRERALRGETVSGVEMPCRRHDGALVTIRFLVAPLDRSGRTVGVVAVMEQVGEDERVRVALTAADDAAETKSRFLASMSYKIRTPMNAVLGMLALALDTELSTDQRQFLGVAHASAQSLMTLLNDILDLSRIEAGRIDLERSEMTVADVLRDVVAALEIRALQKGLRLTCRCSTGVPDAIIGDPLRLRQVLLHLAGNAINFTDKGSIDIAVRPAWIGQSEATLQFSVSDTGIGIPPSKQEAIFRTFRQSEMAGRRVSSGTGLGLALSTRLVELMGGRISVESDVGQGSTFHFTARFGLPPDTNRRRLPERPAEVLTGSRGSGDAQRRLRILLVEDNRVNQLFASRFLQKHGHDVLIAEDGEQAVSRLTSERFDIVLMDVQMPVMDGFEATRLIRKAEQNGGRHTPILAMTAYAMKGDREKCLDAGMDGYVPKPVQPLELLAAIYSLTPGAEASPIPLVDEDRPA
jgi:PAS domain S-box-containing protein